MKRRQQLLDLGDFLWRTCGYGGFSYADLAELADIRKASIHHHFPTKGDLVRAIIDAKRAEAGALAAAWRDATPEAALGAFLDHYEAMLHQPEAVCPAGAMSADIALLPPDAATAARAYLADQRGWLTHLLHAAGRAEPAALADTVLAALQGGLQRARLAGDPELLRGPLRVLRSWMALPAPG